ncbi:hypothetical protein PR202_gb29286 [Eleusine coracana subsp. coracana]|uniref:FCP1 homology domain-containing protein n=1 Tax=Eleusine coracana subsp. coracana TaxID=191504 RepID=A0AAV5FZ16_ELECO|nr:hypothetical protein PR202_gb29286 [Eleusine coracana subsp. coracana]
MAMASPGPPVVPTVFTAATATTPPLPAQQSALPTGALNSLTAAIYDLQRQMEEFSLRLVALESRQVWAAVWLQAAARSLLARRRLQKMHPKMRDREAALAAADLEGVVKCKNNNNKRKQEVANAKENGTMEQKVAFVAPAAESEEVNRKVEMEYPATAVPEGVVKCKKKRKQEVLNVKENGMVEQEAASVASAVEGVEVNRKVEKESPTAAVPEGMAECKKRRKKKREQDVASARENGMTKPEAKSASVMAAVLGMEVTPKLKEEKQEKERVIVEQEATTSTISASEGTTKRKRKKLKKKNKMQEQQELTQAFSGLVAVDKIIANEPGNGGTNGKGVSGNADVSMDPINAEDPVCSESKDATDNDKEKAKEMVMVEQGTTTSAVSAMERIPKFMDEKEKERGVAEQEAPTGTVSASEGTAKLKRKKLRKKNKNKMQEQQESTQALSGLVVVDKIVANKPGNGGTNVEGASGDAIGSMDPINADDPNCSKAKDDNANGKEKVKDMEMVEQETTASSVSATEGKPNCKEEKEKQRGIVEQESTTGTVSKGTVKHKKKRLKKRNKMQELQESTQALSGLVAVDKIVANKLGNGCTNGEGASGEADVSMDPINVEDPNCSKANDANGKVDCKAQDGNKRCSEEFSSLQEGSEDRNKLMGKRKRDASNLGPDISSQDGDKVAKRCLDSSMDHDLSCTCSSCLDQADKEKVKNIYSPGGSLVRFRKKKLLILDLNGLLADINMDHQNAHMAHAKVKGKLVFKRPYYDDFLRFCFQNFELGIWSSRKMENVYSVVNILMRDLKQYLLFCWDMSKCTFTGHKVIGDKYKPLVLKELKKLWNKEDPNLPWEQGEFSPSNTLLVDDSPYKALCNPPYTAIFPQPYSYINQKDDFSLGPGGDLRVYLERLATADDVQDFVRDNPFGQPFITESDPKWNFYAKIVNNVERA